jgi:polysaccharide export outer membrane protein
MRLCARFIDWDAHSLFRNENELIDARGATGLGSDMRNIIHLLAVVVVITLATVSIAVSQVATETTNASGGDYILGPEDQILIRALDAGEISEKPMMIGTSGYISLPMLGRLRVSGLTVEQLETEIVSRLRFYIRDPKVAVSVLEFRSQRVSVLGAVANPGVVQLRGRKSLFEILSEAGGLKNEAGNSVKITRRNENGAIPLPSAANDPSGQFSVAEVSVKSIVEGRNPQENILIMPNDVISVPRAELIYVIGAVRHPGGFVLSEREQVSVLQALSMAEGLDRLASGANARILRSSEPASTRTEIRVDVNKILTGKTRDIPLVANDVLFIPTSGAKSATVRGIEAAIQLGTGIAIWRR